MAHSVQVTTADLSPSIAAVLEKGFKKKAIEPRLLPNSLSKLPGYVYTTMATRLKRCKDGQCQWNTSCTRASSSPLRTTPSRACTLPTGSSRCRMTTSSTSPTPNQRRGPSLEPNCPQLHPHALVHHPPGAGGCTELPPTPPADLPPPHPALPHLFLRLQGQVPHGSWFDHVRGWMEMKGKDNFFFTTYEELQQDLRGSVQRLCQFLGQALDEGALTAVVENASFRAMQENQMCNSTLLPADIMDQEKGTFLRKGSTSRVSLQPLQLAPSACDTSLNLTGTALQTEVHVLGVRCCVIACPGTLGALNALLLGSQPDTHSLRQAHGALCAPACGFLLPSRAEFPPARPFAGVRGAGFLSPPCWQGPSHLALTPALPTPPAPCPEGPEQGQVSLLVKYYSLKREAMFW
ncbi:uncharacterized protein LOC102460158 isoform X6 [Pelodiscus sinensis]